MSGWHEYVRRTIHWATTQGFPIEESVEETSDVQVYELLVRDLAGNVLVHIRQFNGQWSLGNGFLPPLAKSL